MYAQNAHTEFHRDCAISLGAISKQIFVTGHTNKQTNKQTNKHSRKKTSQYQK